MDYCFYGSDSKSCTQAEAVAKVVEIVDTDTGCTQSIMCRQKGAQDRYAVVGAQRFIAGLGMAKCTIRTDGEQPILAFQEAVAKELRAKNGITVIEKQAPRYSHGSQGAVETMVRHNRNQFTVFRDDLERRLGGFRTITMDMPLAPWLIRHAPWVTNRFQPRAEGHSSYYKLHGVEYSSTVCIPGETVQYRDAKPSANMNKARSPWKSGVWLGKTDKSDENIIGTPMGIDFARTVRRRPKHEQFSEEDVFSMIGTPWDLRPVQDAEAFVPPPQLRPKAVAAPLTQTRQVQDNRRQHRRQR